MVCHTEFGDVRILDYIQANQHRDQDTRVIVETALVGEEADFQLGPFIWNLREVHEDGSIDWEDPPAASVVSKWDYERIFGQ